MSYDNDWDRRADEFSRRPARTTLQYGFVVIAVFAALAIVGGIVSFGLGWFNAGAEIVSPNNVRDQYQHVIEDYEALEASAANACGAKRTASGPDDPVLVENPTLAYEAKYRSIAVDYNRRQLNIFEAKLVGPKGYPRYAPTLREMKREVC